MMNTSSELPAIVFFYQPGSWRFETRWTGWACRGRYTIGGSWVDGSDARSRYEKTICSMTQIHLVEELMWSMDTSESKCTGNHVGSGPWSRLRVATDTLSIVLSPNMQVSVPRVEKEHAHHPIIPSSPSQSAHLMCMLIFIMNDYEWLIIRGVSFLLINVPHQLPGKIHRRHNFEERILTLPWKP